MSNAETQWAALASAYTADQQLVRKLWEELHQYYSASDRYYHNLHHIEALLTLATEHRAMAKHEDPLRFSIFYHDIIYNATQNDNEEKSAALAAKRLQELAFSEASVALVKEMILATKSHQKHEQEDVNLLIDFDLSVLGSDWNSYCTYTIQIRKEYSVFPDYLYKKGRKKVLERFLSQHCIYEFQKLLEGQARSNLQRELLTL